MLINILADVFGLTLKYVWRMREFATSLEHFIALRRLSLFQRPPFLIPISVPTCPQWSVECGDGNLSAQLQKNQRCVFDIFSVFQDFVFGVDFI